MLKKLAKKIKNAMTRASRQQQAEAEKRVIRQLASVSNTAVSTLSKRAMYSSRLSPGRLSRSAPC
jgi:hypothetical protein